MTYCVTIPGDPVSKKNRRVGTGKRSHYEPGVTQTIQSIQCIMAAKWAQYGFANRQRLTNAELLVQVYPSNRRSDLDGYATTLIDCLVKAGVLYNDSMAHLVNVRVKWVCHPKLLGEKGSIAQIKLTGELTEKEY